MTSYVPQPIPCYEAQEMQSFRRGNCQPYEARYLTTANAIAMTNVMIRRPKSGAAVDVYIVDINDNDLGLVTVPSKTNHDLDTEGEYEMLTLNAGNWTLLFSPSGGLYYFRIETDSTYFSEAVYLEPGADGWPTCSDDFAKLTWTDGRCIVSAKTSDNTHDVLTYPDLSHTFFMYLRGNVAQPEWEIEEQGGNDANGVFIADSRRLAKRWKFTGHPINEAAVDALQASALFETVTIEFQTAQAFTGVRDIKVNPQWEQGGCFARYEYSFTSDYLLKRNCC